MKRVRGVDEITPPTAPTLKHSGGGGAVGGGGGSIDFHSSAGIGVVSGQAVRSVPSKEMPGSIQFSQTQQQYPGAIVVPTAAPSPAKVRNHELLYCSIRDKQYFISYCYCREVLQLGYQQAPHVQQVA